jgi:hypothetical protein
LISEFFMQFALTLFCAAALAHTDAQGRRQVCYVPAIFSRARFVSESLCFGGLQKMSFGRWINKKFGRSGDRNTYHGIFGAFQVLQAALEKSYLLRS